jgi:cell division protein FtsL
MKLLNAFLVLCVLVAGFFAYSLEHQTRGLERKISKLERQIVEEREAIKFAKAEWSSLIRPDRLQEIAEQTLDVVPMKATQLITADEIKDRVPAEPIIKLETENADPIGDIIEKMR